MRTSDRGSAVAEFVFLVLPLLGLAGSTLAVSWYSFSKAQLVQITSEAAMQLAEGDTSYEEVRETVSGKLAQRISSKEFSFSGQSAGGLATVTVELPNWEIIAPFSLILPELSVVKNAPMEAQ